MNETPQNTESLKRAADVFKSMRAELIEKYGNAAKVERALAETAPQVLLATIYALDDRFAKLAKQLAERIAALESQAESFKDFGYQGVWKSGDVYRRGNFVTDGGGLWHCEQATQSRPGTNGDDWKLCVKNGSHR